MLADCNYTFGSRKFGKSLIPIIGQVLINGVTSQVRISTSAFGVGRYYEEPFRFCDSPETSWIDGSSMELGDL